MIERVAVCSWSLRPESPEHLVAQARAAGVMRVQLALDPLVRDEWSVERTVAALDGAGIEVVSGMIGFAGEDYATLETIRATGGVRPDATWPANLAHVHAAAGLARRLGITLTTFHAGFLPHDERDPERAVLLDRLATITRVFNRQGCGVAFETGQETAATLLEALRDLRLRLPPEDDFGVNFDPANMILYGMGDPVEALRTLARHVRQVHVKDAKPAAQPGTWGSEEAVGAGSVRWAAFFEAVRAEAVRADLVIEREAGERRVEDVRRARALMAQLDAEGPAPERRGVGVGVAVVGMGFMGRTHASAVVSAAASGVACRLVAVADRDAARLTGRGAGGNLDAGAAADAWRAHGPAVESEIERVLDNPAVDVVVIATHTDSHVDLARRCMRAGKHVLIEKPVALTAGEVRRVAEAANDAGRLCVPAMCMRHWPGWVWLKARLRDGTLGGVRSAVFQRLGSAPTWSPFYADAARSGGALVDLHVHDADFVGWLLGLPCEVASTGSSAHVSTHYRYTFAPGSGPVAPDGSVPRHVMAEGGQDHAEGFGFRMRYVVVFERATADFDLGRTPALLLHGEGRSEAIDLPAESGYQAQMRHLLGLVARGSGRPVASIGDAVRTAALVDAERESVATQRPVAVA